MKRSANILTFYHSGQILQSIPVEQGQERLLTVGSQQGQVDVSIPDPLVSRVHAQLMVDAQGRCTLIDMGSTNGTFLAGERIPPHVPTPVQPGQEIAFGGRKVATLRIQASTEGAAPPPHPGTSPSIAEMLARKPELSIGRSSDCDIVIDSSLVSRLHAKLRKLPDGKLMLIDLGSTNGTFVNGQRIQGAVQVKQSDTIIVGRSIIALDSGARNLGGEIAIRTEGMRKDFPNGKTGLRETTLEIPAGRLVAIMGPSGCGKSTLLKCLTGEAPPSHGKVYLHNLELVQNYTFLKTLIGYVPQDDIVHRELTVEQSLYYAARLRMEKPSRQQIELKIKDVLQRLRIEHIRHSPIGKISGGQRKRVSIAVELLTDPLILFLDEPTSPLDPQTIKEFLEILQGLAHQGTTVVMVTHKPEDLDYMDSVIFMAEGGAMVYEGSTTGYKDYFGVRSAVEVYACISGPQAPQWIQRFRGRQAAVTSGTPGTHPRLAKKSNKSIFAEFRWLAQRYLRIKTNDLVNLAILIGQAPVIALLVCMIFDKITLSVPFLITLSAIWFGTSNAAREIVAEAAVYRRERMFNLRIGPYMLSKLGVLGLFGLIQAVLFSVIIAIGFRHTSPPWIDLPSTILWVWLLTVVANALGLAVSALVDTAEKAMTLVPLMLIPQVMLAGVVSPMNNNYMEVVSYISPSRWGNEGMTMIQILVHNGAYDGIMAEIEDEGETEEENEFANSIIRDEVDSTIYAREALEGQYDDSYERTFGKHAYTLRLDFQALCILTLLFLTTTWIAMKRKDSI